MDIKPVGDAVFLTAVSEAEAVDGIIIPETARTSGGRFIVAAVSDEAAQQIPIKIGDMVLVEKDKQVDLEIKGEKFCSVKAADIAAILG